MKVEKHNDPMCKKGTAKVSIDNTTWYMNKEQWKEIGHIMGWFQDDQGIDTSHIPIASERGRTGERY